MNSITTASNQAQNGLVTLVEWEPRVSHFIIAKNTWNEPRAIRVMIEKYFERLEKKWVMTFEMSKPKTSWGRPQKEYFLNEKQAIFLMTLLKNSEVVVDFKDNLTSAFFELKEKSQEQEKPRLAPLHWYSEEETTAILEKLIEELDSQIKQTHELQKYKNEKELEEVKYSSGVSLFASTMLRAAKDHTNTQELIHTQQMKIEELEKQKALPAPVTVDDSKGRFSVAKVGGMLGLWEKTFFAMLRGDKILTKDNRPLIEYIERGYMKIIMSKYRRWDELISYAQAFISPKWVEWLRNRYCMAMV